MWTGRCNQCNLSIAAASPLQGRHWIRDCLAFQIPQHDQQCWRGAALWWQGHGLLLLLLLLRSFCWLCCLQQLWDLRIQRHSPVIDDAFPAI